MIVCLCLGVSDSEVRSTIRRGATTVDDVTQACGAGGDCGSCCEMIGCMIDETASREAARDSRGESTTNNSIAA